jgi:hypothetical protein
MYFQYLESFGIQRARRFRADNVKTIWTCSHFMRQTRALVMRISYTARCGIRQGNGWQTYSFEGTITGFKEKPTQLVALMVTVDVPPR